MTAIGLFGASARERAAQEAQVLGLQQRNDELLKALADRDAALARAQAAAVAEAARAQVLGDQLAALRATVAAGEESLTVAKAQAAEHAEALAAKAASCAEAERQAVRFERYKENQGKQINRLGERLALSESVVHGLPEPMIVVDVDGNVTYANGACRAAAGVAAEVRDDALREADIWQFADQGASPLATCLARQEASLDSER